MKWLSRLFPGRKRKLSVVVIVYDMNREAPRTLYSLSADYQQDIRADDYEVIVVDNGSPQPLGESVLEGLSGNFRYVYREPGNPSPVQAINHGASLASGDMIGVLIDGARIVTPGLLAWALRARGAFDQPVVSTLNWHLGPKIQNKSIEAGYDKAEEDRLLASIDWKQNGYELHAISALGGSSQKGYFRSQSESNAIFLTRALFWRLGGYDEGFQTPGGGFSNLDFYKRACETPGTALVVLLGEGSFHQLHGGIMTNANKARKQARWDEYQAEYQALRGKPYEDPLREAIFMGPMPKAGLPVLEQSVKKALNEYRASQKEGEGQP